MDVFFSNYYFNIFEKLNDVDTNDINKIINLLIKVNKKKNKIFIFGNGGSASIASHVSVDMTKILNFRSYNFNEANLITCFSNDYGYENWISNTINAYSKPGDLVILISSSGKSKNIINAAKLTNKKKLNLITFSGFLKNNPLKKLGNINIWINSRNYNIIETTHQTILLSIIDYISLKILQK